MLRKTENCSIIPHSVFEAHGARIRNAGTIVFELTTGRAYYFANVKAFRDRALPGAKLSSSGYRVDPQARTAARSALRSLACIYSSNSGTRITNNGWCEVPSYSRRETRDARADDVCASPRSNGTAFSAFDREAQ